MEICSDPYNASAARKSSFLTPPFVAKTTMMAIDLENATVYPANLQMTCAALRTSGGMKFPFVDFEGLQIEEQK